MIPTWSAPNWLWLLLLVPIFFVLHLLIRTVRNQEFSSLRIWKRVRHVLNRKKNPTPSIQNVITALLLSLLLSGLILSLAGPNTRFTSRQKDLHLLVDLSASMQITHRQDVSRYQRAMRKLQDIADRTSSLSTWSATLLTKPVTTHQGTPSEVMSFLRNQSPTDLSYQRSLATIAQKFAEQTEKSTYLITDTPAPTNSSGTDRFRRLLVGSPKKNTGIVYLRGSRSGSSLELSMQLAHHGPEERTVQIEVLTDDGTVHHNSTRTVPAESPISHFVELEDWNRVTGRVELEMDAPDALPSDNTAYFATTSPYRVRTKMIGETNQHLHHLLSSLSTVHLVEDRSDATVAYKPNSKRTRTIWNGTNQKTIVVNPEVPEDLPFKIRRTNSIQAPNPETHSLVRNLSMNSVTIRNGRMLTNQQNNESIIPLITHRDRPIVFLRRGEAPQIWILFDPFFSPGNALQSNWSIHPETYPDFVQFWQNIFEQFQELNVPYRGDIVYWKTGEETELVQAEQKDQKTELLTTKVGLNRVKINGSTKPLPVNLTSRSETNTIFDQINSQWSSIRQETEEVTQSAHTDTLTRALLVLFIFSLIAISFLHRTSTRYPSR